MHIRQKISGRCDKKENVIKCKNILISTHRIGELFELETEVDKAEEAGSS